MEQVDDLIALALLCSEPAINLIGVVLLEADCLLDPGMMLFTFFKYDILDKRRAECNTF